MFEWLLIIFSVVMAFYGIIDWIKEDDEDGKR